MFGRINYGRRGINYTVAGTAILKDDDWIFEPKGKNKEVFNL